MDTPVTANGAMSSKRSARDHALLVLFTLALAWAFLALGILLFGERVGALNPAPEGTSLHSGLESWGPCLAAVVAASAFSVLVARLKPRFLRVPRQVTSLRLWITLLVTTAIVGAGLLLALVVVTMVLDPPGPHPENVQYIPLVFWLPALVTSAISPVAGVLIACAWASRRRPPN